MMEIKVNIDSQDPVKFTLHESTTHNTVHTRVVATRRCRGDMRDKHVFISDFYFVFLAFWN